MTDRVSTASRTEPHRLDATVAGGALGLLLLGVGLLSATGTTGEFFAWRGRGTPTSTPGTSGRSA